MSSGGHSFLDWPWVGLLYRGPSSREGRGQGSGEGGTAGRLRVQITVLGVVSLHTTRYHHLKSVLWVAFDIAHRSSIQNGHWSWELWSERLDSRPLHAISGTRLRTKGEKKLRFYFITHILFLFPVNFLWALPVTMGHILFLWYVFHQITISFFFPLANVSIYFWIIWSHQGFKWLLNVPTWPIAWKLVLQDSASLFVLDIIISIGNIFSLQVSLISSPGIHSHFLRILGSRLCPWFGPACRLESCSRAWACISRYKTMTP